MTEITPPLLPELEGWAIVSEDQVGPACSAGPGKAQRLVARSRSSHLEVIYDEAIDRQEKPEKTIAEKINLLVMAAAPAVLKQNRTVRISLS